ncbi:hypothetical protein Sjap_007775 [Stephania japonica]|uniref:Uncharacterized protein n=1 Tax=Stephania japonica TaxID=461633 RepID=A0AAP0JN85_9MAGN
MDPHFTSSWTRIRCLMDSHFTSCSGAIFGEKAQHCKKGKDCRLILNTIWSIV